MRWEAREMIGKLTDEVIDMLEALGNTADLVAAGLQKAGIKGIRGDNRYCPIALYVQAKLLERYPNRNFIVDVYSTMMTVHEVETIGARVVAEVRFYGPELTGRMNPVATFIDRFDGRDDTENYPALAG